VNGVVVVVGGVVVVVVERLTRLAN